jgi:hypothetical protein
MKTTIDMAREAGAIHIHENPKEFAIVGNDSIKAFEALVRADEREIDAKMCEELPAPDIYSDTDKSMWDVTCMDCAAAIRARENK